MNPAITSTTLVNTLASRSESSTAIRFASALFVTALTAAAAQISVPLPFTVVPFTFQPMILLLGGLALGSRLGFLSQVMYLAAGIAGLPVFAASPELPSGALRMIGPTGGYLMSYPLAAFIAGYFGERGFDRHYAKSWLAMSIGLVVIFAGGCGWLALSVGLPAALATGVYPFVLADLMKLVVAAGVLPGMWRLIGRASR